MVNAYVIYGFVEQFNAAYNDVHLAMLLAGAVKDENGCVVAIKVQEAVLIGVNPLYCSESFVSVALVLAVKAEELLKVVLHSLISLGCYRTTIEVGWLVARYLACEVCLYTVGIALQIPANVGLFLFCRV